MCGPTTAQVTFAKRSSDRVTFLLKTHTCFPSMLRIKRGISPGSLRAPQDLTPARFSQLPSVLPPCLLYIALSHSDHWHLSGTSDPKAAPSPALSFLLLAGLPLSSTPAGP